MKMPWTDKTGLSKAAAFLATIFLVSLGLCGMNFVTIFASSKMSAALQNREASILVVLAFVEAAGLVLSTVGLFAVAILAIIMNAGKKKRRGE